LGRAKASLRANGLTVPDTLFALTKEVPTLLVPGANAAVRGSAAICLQFK
jgi:hypothetical protein